MSEIKLTADSGGGTTSIKAPSTTTSNADVVLKLPVADGSSGQVIKTDGSGQLSFTSNAGTTINNNADNRVITGSGTASTLNGEANCTFNGDSLGLNSSSTTEVNLQYSNNTRLKIHAGSNFAQLLTQNDVPLSFKTDAGTGSGTSRLVINTNGNIGIGTTSPSTKLDVIGDIRTSTNIYLGESIFHDGDNDTKIRFPAADNISMEVAGTEVFKAVPDAAHGSTPSTRLLCAHTVDGAAVNMGGTKAYSGGIIRGMANIRDAQAYNVTDNGGGIGFSAIYNNGGSHTTMSQIEGVKANNTDGNYEGAIKFSTRHNLGNMIEKVRIGKEGLSFEGATADANCIKDYEEGTWTINTDVGSPNHTYSASYTKIGRSVTVSVYITCPTSSSGNNFRITSLPFTSLGSANYAIGACYTQVHTTDNVFVQVNPGNNDLYVYKRVGNAVTFADLSGAYLLFTVTYFEG